MTTGYQRMHETPGREDGSAVGRLCVASGCTRLNGKHRRRADPEYRARETARDLARRAERHAMNHHRAERAATGQQATNREGQS